MASSATAGTAAVALNTGNHGSQRRTHELDAPKIVEWAKEDEVDVALLVPL